MTLLIIVIVGVMLIQIGILVLTRTKIKKERANSIIEKYNIKSSGDAWKLLNNPDISKEDRDKIESIYSGENQSD
jgi:hypothetical protein